MFLQQLVNGLTLGSLYAVLAIGLTLVFGVLNIINMAHGGIFMIGAFVGYYAINSLKMNFWIALVFSMIVCAILGVVIEFLAYRPLRNSTRISALITAIIFASGDVTLFISLKLCAIASKSISAQALILGHSFVNLKDLYIISIYIISKFLR